VETRLIVGVTQVASRARKNSEGMRIYSLNDTLLCFGDLDFKRLIGLDEASGVEVHSTEDWLVICEVEICRDLFGGSDSTIVTVPLGPSKGFLAELEVRAM